ncbi:hypothetical protein, conserved [Babesia bigemina]|uniref:Uncharacterized protein n=1 Tax=Babesia bigemina TaxID=5866 RepID=A0A061D964_BABBI|nr:hypothetical protein, conserved [Babesia bigemina]CDR94260.1 hypothetical protein, conserved [Babesia bigemina]|eukprot:XP_012766446.1 hypothetical protein, conserved [Babesia bigemina]
MGACQSRDEQEVAVTTPKRGGATNVCDERLEDRLLTIPEISYGPFNRVALEWDTLGQLIPYNPESIRSATSAQSGDAVSEAHQVRKQLTSIKQPANLAKGDDNAASTNMQRFNSRGVTDDKQSLDQFRRAIVMWTNFKTSTNAVKKLHGVTDAWSYLDAENVPLPQEMFGSDGSESINELQGSEVSVGSALTQEDGPDGAMPDLCESGDGHVPIVTTEENVHLPFQDLRQSLNDLTQQPSSFVTHPASPMESDAPMENIDDAIDWLNYELVLRPYSSKDTARHSYKCIYRPRREFSPRDRVYRLDSNLLQLLGDILDPFQSHNEDQDRLSVGPKVKLLLNQLVSVKEWGSSTIQDNANSVQGVVTRKTKRVMRRPFDLRALSTISDSGDVQSPCAHPFYCLEDSGCDAGSGAYRDIHGTKENKHSINSTGNYRPHGRYGDMSDIPLLF